MKKRFEIEGEEWRKEERQAESEKNEQKKKTRPLRNVSAHSRFLPLLLAFLFSFRRSGRAAMSCRASKAGSCPRRLLDSSRAAVLKRHALEKERARERSSKANVFLLTTIKSELADGESPPKRPWRQGEQSFEFSLFFL